MLAFTELSTILSRDYDDAALTGISTSELNGTGETQALPQTCALRLARPRQPRLWSNLTGPAITAAAVLSIKTRLECCVMPEFREVPVTGANLGGLSLGAFRSVSSSTPPASDVGPATG